MIGGARLTGRVGKQTVGLLNIVTDSAFDQPRTNFAVARVTRGIGASNYVGAIATDRRSADHWNTTAGIDGSFWPAGALNVQAFVAQTWSKGDGGEGAAYRVGVDLQTDRFGLTAQHLYVGPDATADMGFITREDIRRTGGFTRYTRRPPILGLRRVDTFVSAEHIVRSDGLLQDWQVGIGLNPSWNSGESVVVFGFRGFTRLDEGFDLKEDEPVVSVPAGDYDVWQFGWFANSSANRPVVFGSNGSIQRFFDGDLVSVNGSITVNPDPHLALSLSYTRNDVEVPNGAFTADIGALRISYAFSTRLFANALLQYNSLDNAVSANVRINFIHRPGSDLFIVFNEQRGSASSLWHLDSRGAVVKITYLARI